MKLSDLGRWLGFNSSATAPAPPPTSFEPTRRVWSRGLALLTDHHGGLEFVRDQRGGQAPLRFPADAFDGVRDGDLVWMRAFTLPQFVAEALPRIRARFTLLTGDEDLAIPGGSRHARALLDDPRLLVWCAQNVDAPRPHPRLQLLPIGLDFHTIALGARWGHPQTTPTEQEHELDALVADFAPNRDRLRLAHADFHFSRRPRGPLGGERAACERALRKSPAVMFQERMVRRLDLWREKGRYAFVVSPHGNGLDCHRTWESLALGNIVIVKRSSLDPLYEGLPVVIVREWSEVTPANLERWHHQHAAAFEQPEVQSRLTNAYWIERARRLGLAALQGPQSLDGPAR